MPRYKKILAFANDKLDRMVSHRQAIHEYPETALEEHKTSAYIEHVLNELGIPNKRITDTGIIATIGKGDRCVALRADIDALPITEETGLGFSSKVPGKMHACGHDLHISMLLGAAEILKKNFDDVKGSVRLIFQPSEEKLPGGALLMIEHGALENPAPGAIFGQHVDPGTTTGAICLAKGYVMASADELYWTITGKSTHAAQPHLGSDAILASASLVSYLQSMVNKFRNPLIPGLLSVTSIHGGTATNIFPEEVKLMGTLRAFENEWRDFMHRELPVRSAEICRLFNAGCTMNILKGYPPVFNNNKTTDIARKAAGAIFGDSSVLGFEPKMWAEDFAWYAQKIPGTFWFLGVRPKGIDDMPPLHNAKFAPDEAAMPYGAAMMASVALDYLESAQ